MIEKVDKRPLTDETFKEMGFREDDEMAGFWFYEVKNIYSDAHTEDCQLMICGDSKRGEVYLYEIGDRLWSPRWFTVGSVRMLIETLKGDSIKEKK